MGYRDKRVVGVFVRFFVLFLWLWFLPTYEPTLYLHSWESFWLSGAASWRSAAILHQCRHQEGCGQALAPAGASLAMRGEQVSGP
jgi:hypothetical protein